MIFQPCCLRIESENAAPYLFGQPTFFSQITHQLQQLRTLGISAVYRWLLVIACIVIHSVMFPAEHIQAQTPPPAPVVVSEVIEEEIHSGQEYLGSIYPSRLATIGSAVDGRVVEFPVNEGDRVTSGSTLAQLLTETIKLDLLAAQSELELRQQELSELVNGTRPEEIAQAEARQQAAQSNLAYAQSNFDRVKSLLDRNAVNEDQFQLVKAELYEAQANLSEQKAAYDQAVAGPRQELILQKKAAFDIQNAMVQQLEDRIKKHTIVTRFDGYITKEYTEQGAWVKQGDPVADVAALDTVLIESQILDSHINFIELGQSVRIDVPALPGQVFIGVVKHIIPQADIRTRTFPVKIEVTNQFQGELPILKSGMLARVTLPTGATQQATLVPKDAVVLGGKSPCVYVVEPSSNAQQPSANQTGKVILIPVSLGVAKASYVQVNGQLSVGQLVITRGNERVRPDQIVTINEIAQYNLEPAPIQPTPAQEGQIAPVNNGLQTKLP